MTRLLSLRRAGPWLAGLAWLWWSAAATASTGDQIEYFFDVDPGPGNGTLVASSPGGAGFTANTAGLAPGTHTLYLRVRPEGGEWGPKLPVTVAIEPSSPLDKVSAWESSLDTPAAPGTGSPLPVLPDMEQQATVSAVVPLGAAVTGTHTVWLRARSNGGAWGAAFPLAVSIDDSDAYEHPTAVEFSWDENPATRSWTTVNLPTPGAMAATLGVSPPVGGIGLGTRSLSLRAVDESGSRGPALLIPVAVVPDSLTGHASPPAKLVSYATDASGMIAGTYREITLSTPPGAHHSFELPLTSAVPGNAEVVSYVVTQNGESSPQAKTSFTVVIEGTNGLAAWLQAGGWFTPAELANPAICGPNADPEGDGQSNLEEFAFRTHPRESNPPVGTSMAFANGRMTFSFRQLAGGSGHRAYNYTAQGVSYRVEWSADPGGGWKSGGGEVFEVLSVTSNGDGTDNVVVAADPSITNGRPKVFLRLRMLLL